MCSHLARAVVIESQHLSDTQLSRIGKTLSNLISLSNVLMGSRRITHFMLQFIDFTPLEIIPFVYIKSNQFLTKYLDKLSKLTQFRSNANNMTNISKSICDKNVEKNIELTIRRILNDKKPEEINLIEMTFISGRHEKDVIQDICHVLKKLDFNQNTFQSMLSTINILCISRESSEQTRFEMNEKPIICGPSGSTTFNSSKIAEEFKALIETQTIDDSEIAIEGFFKLWFHDSIHESEKIRICLKNNNNINEDFMIKCDVKEAILDVNLIPVMKRAQLDSCRSQTIPPSILANNNRIIDCYELKIDGFVKRDGFCDSLVFGIPYILSPTRCHNLSFSELEQNVHRFHALIQIMNEKQAFIILEHKQQLSPINYFVLMSSPDKKVVLLKSLATKELLLPYSNDSVDKLMSNTPTKQMVDSVRQLLSDIPFADIFNPLYVTNNLYEFIAPDGSSHPFNNH